MLTPKTNAKRNWSLVADPVPVSYAHHQDKRKAYLVFGGKLNNPPTRQTRWLIKLALCPPTRKLCSPPRQTRSVIGLWWQTEQPTNTTNAKRTWSLLEGCTALDRKTTSLTHSVNGLFWTRANATGMYFDFLDVMCPRNPVPRSLSVNGAGLRYLLTTYTSKGNEKTRQVLK